jgi:colanic acid biosynthesis glycosyl transferase WcaI
MKVLIHSINFWPEPTGVGKYTGEMAEWLSLRGHEVRAVTTPPHYPQWRILEGYSPWRFTRETPVLAAGSLGKLEVIRCPVWIPRAPRGWRRIVHLASFSLLSWPVMLRQVRWKPDIVILVAPTIFCFPQVASLAWLSRAVSWLHVQDFEIDVAFQLGDFTSQSLQRWVNVLERFIFRRFDRVSAISIRMLDRLSAKGVNPRCSSLFPNWVDTASIYPMPNPSPFRQELGIPPQCVVVLYSGNMGKKQGLDLLVETSRKLAARTDIRFVFCGEGSYRETFVQQTLGAGNVTILPLQPVERLNELLNMADIHVLPQLANAADLVMPSKLTGMMASGRPVVATALPATQLFGVLQGRGLATPPGDADAFAAAIVLLAEGQELRARLGKAARKYAVEHLNRDDILRRFELSMLNACTPSPQDSGKDRHDYKNGARVAEELALTQETGGED